MEEQNVSEKKYRNLLNNLLEIRRGDPAIFFKVDESRRFDLTKQIDLQDSRKILENKDFQINLNENNLQKLIKKAKSIQDWSDLKHIYKIYKKSDSNLGLSAEDLQIEKKKLIEELETKLQKRFKRWKIFQRKIQTAYDDKGVWPLFIGTFLLACRVADKTLYAPMFLKKVYIDTEANQRIVLKNIDAKWSINEKLRFRLDHYENPPPPIILQKELKVLKKK